MKSEKKYKIKSGDQDIILSFRDEVRVNNIAMAQQAKRKVDIITRNFDPGVYDNSDYIEALKQLAISSKFIKIRVLIKDSDTMIKRRHRITDIIQQLTSRIEVRCVADEYKSFNEAFSLYDDKAIVYLRYADRYEGIANFNQPRLAAELTSFFNEIWEHSVPDQNLRRLQL